LLEFNSPCESLAGELQVFRATVTCRRNCGIGAQRLHPGRLTMCG
jgi:hypothetical protein